MERSVYINGEFVKESQAKISVFDRGFLFADSVYEVCAVIDGKLVDFDGHMARLSRSAKELGLKLELTTQELSDVHQELISQNQVTEGCVYLQLTRGDDGDRDFVASDTITPTLVLFTQVKNLLNNPKSKTGVKVISYPDIRWGRRDIKTTGLLAACMAKSAAKSAGVEDVWLTQDDHITEGGSNNVYIVTQDNTLITHPLDTDILHGITRHSVLQLAEQCGLKIEERRFSLEEAYQAKEAFTTSATTFVLPVIEIDGKKIGDGKAGEISQKLFEIYVQAAKSVS